MAEQYFSVTKKRGRPPGRSKPETTVIRLETEILRRVDAAIAAEPEATRPSRSELIRRIVADWLANRGFMGKD